MTDYLNSWDLELIWDSGYILRGIYSINDNYYSDRRWKLRYTTVPNTCKLTVDAWTGWFDYDIEHNIVCSNDGKVIVAINTQHDNSREDRRWRVKCAKMDCEFADTWADSCTKKCKIYANTPTVTTNSGVDTVTWNSPSTFQSYNWEMSIGPVGGSLSKISGSSPSTPKVEWSTFNNWQTSDWNKQYQVSLTITDKNTCNSQRSLATTFTHHCSCNSNSDKSNGQPSITATQTKAIISLQTQLRSYCSTRLFFLRRFNSFETGLQSFTSSLDVEITKCLSPPNLEKDDLTTLGRISSELGKTVTYCAFVVNSAMDYKTDYNTLTNGCTTIQIAFFTTVSGFIRSAGGITPIPGVTLTYNIGGITGTVQTNNAGFYEITVQSSTITSSTVTGTITPQFTSAGVEHRFTCTGYPGCTAIDLSVPIDKRNYKIQRKLQHAQDIIVDFKDESTVTISGKAFLDDTALYTRDKKPCFLPGVEICPYQVGQTTLMSSCTKTSTLDGSYEIAVPIGISVNLFPKYTHQNKSVTINPSVIKLEQLEYHYFDQDFFVSKTFQVDITVAGGTCKKKLGETTILEITMPSFCPSYTRTETIIGGGIFRQLRLPISDFKVKVDSIKNDVFGSSGLEIIQYLENTKQRELYGQIYSEGATSGAGIVKPDSSSILKFDFNYRSSLQLSVQVGPEGVQLCSGAFVVEENNPTNITLLAWESYGTAGDCRNVGNLTVNFKDLVTDGSYTCSQYNGCGITLNLIDFNRENRSGVITTTVPGLQSGYLRSVIFDYKDAGRPNYPVHLNRDVIVTGKKSLGDSFTVTLSEGNPITILYDPPGSMSTSKISQGSSITSTFTTETSNEFGGGVEDEVKIGVDGKTKACTGFGVELCLETFEATVYGGVRFELKGSDSTKDVNTWSHTFSLSTSISTSKYIGNPGRYSDVVVSSAIALIFEKVYVYSVKRNRTAGTCEVVRDISVTWRPSVEGYSIKTIYDIENIEIPNIKELMIAVKSRIDKNVYSNNAEGVELKSLDIDNLRLLNNSLNNWQQIVNLRDSRKSGTGLIAPEDFYSQIRCQNAKDTGKESKFDNCDEIPINTFSSDGNNIFYSGGGIQFFLSAEWQRSHENPYTETSNFEHLTGIRWFKDITAFGFKVKNEFFGSFTYKRSTSETYITTEDKKNSVEFTLGDIHIGDYFNVKLMYDSQFHTPYFQTQAGVSSCPWEENTIPREDPRIFITGSPFNYLPPDSPVEIPVRIVNRSPTNEARNYRLQPRLGTNEKGLQLNLNGAALQYTFLQDVPTTEKGLDLTIIATRNPTSYNYTGIVLDFYSDCELGIYNGDGLARAPLTSSATFDVLFQQYCSPVNFAGTLSEDNTFTIKLHTDSTYTLLVQATNPEHHITPWNKHPKLKYVTIQYRKVGDAEWQRAVTKTGSFANLMTDQTGFAEVEIDVTLLSDGKYELRLLSYCSAESGLIGQQTSSTIVGTIDRVLPTPFTSFNQPSDGEFFPGDDISIFFTEDIDCRIPYTFTINMVIKDKNNKTISIDSDDIDILCEENKIIMAFTLSSNLYNWETLMGKSASVYLTGVRDIVGNVMQNTVLWKFNFAVFDLDLTALEIRLRFSDLEISERDIPRLTSEISVAAGTSADQIEILSVRSSTAHLKIQPGEITPLFAGQNILRNIDSAEESSMLYQAELLHAAIVSKKKQLTGGDVPILSNSNCNESSILSSGVGIGFIVLLVLSIIVITIGFMFLRNSFINK
eukprot:TRINITY_DN81_c0_g1_i2.p1 TRINITY_DN81_c0_g1~~TRINITY_DN81_c0_g1_i2.p1  ORF type:complete len:2020 (+),score=309.20 TRINITY_DN81_c0_g1_i2:851-6061(+)